MVITASLKGRTYEASVVAGDAGKAEIEFGGKRYTSLSADGGAAAGLRGQRLEVLAASRGAGSGVMGGGPPGRLSGQIQLHLLR